VFPLLDADGANVIESAQPVSTMVTCGACHDTAFIATHSFHADAGLGQLGAPGSVPGGRPWDTSPGLFGEWSPLFYRYLSPQGDARVDLTTPEWLGVYGLRHVGGGPGVTSRDGAPLVDLAPSAADVEASLIDPATGLAQPWDWSESGTAEMNCFLCHMPDANNEARKDALTAGAFGDAATATLIGSGIVDGTAASWSYNPDAFGEDGALKPAFITVQDPATANCGNCHGVTHVDMETPLTLDGLNINDWNTLTTGQIMSPQRINDSGLNLADKGTLSRSWDVHMERVVGCTDCHYSLNNPIYYRESDSPDYLTFDPRRVDISEYLYRPLHQFAKGSSAQGGLAPELDDTLRRCESCHSIELTHDWLPYKEAHTQAMACETCHVPELYAPAVEYVDWTVLTADGEPVTAYRGVESNVIDATTLITPYTPIILPRENADGTTTMAPFNLISAWYWVYGDPARPVPERDLRAAFFEGEAYYPDILAAFDGDGDGALSAVELSITTDAQKTAVAGRLAALGLDNPRIEGEVQPFSINHNVAQGEWVTRACNDCHGEASRLAAPLSLSDRTPGGVQPALYEGGPVSWPGTIAAGEDGALRFQPDTGEAGLYILGHNAAEWVDWIGIAMVLGVVLGVFVHGGLRVISARKRAAEVDDVDVATRRVYMYDVYERLWHWLQTAVILLLLFTGLIIHKPDRFGMFSFSYVVQVHNILALLLVINAALALFYHLASGEIKQFLPRPKGFFDQAFEQAIFYMRGIFRGEAHPFEKTRDRKLNPLQQMTYLVILNVLLPLQILTGALMWGSQRWPDAAGFFGGLPGLGPFHSLVAWAFAAFIILHVYLTTTGPTPTAGIQAMMLGWEDVEAHDGAEHSRPEAAAAD
jgi:thiosulfate reductase cytochrome b subunit